MLVLMSLFFKFSLQARRQRYGYRFYYRFHHNYSSYGHADV